MKIIHNKPAICVSINGLGNMAHAVHFAEDYADVHKHTKPQWSFIVPAKHPFEIGKQYVIQVCDPTVAAE